MKNTNLKDFLQADPSHVPKDASEFIYNLKQKIDFHIAE
jgi:hypothetical protein